MSSSGTGRAAQSTGSPAGRGRSLLALGVAVVLVIAVIVLPGKHASSGLTERNGPRVVTTTGILGDLATRVAGEHADVVSLVPPGGDPHTYEPTLRDVRDIVHADLALSNYMMLEEQSLIRTIDANLPDGAPHVALAEEASGYGAEIIPLVENHSLETVWLGLRVRGGESKPDADRLSQVRMNLKDATGPGEAYAYVTGTFGKPQSVFATTDDAPVPPNTPANTISLPLDAHTHLSWAFTKPGVYRLELDAQFLQSREDDAQPVADTTLTVAVGTDPTSALPGVEQPTVLDSGHVDITADLAREEIKLVADAQTEDGEATTRDLDPATTVLSVPPKALMPIPGDPSYRFIGRPGTDVYQLPQAVLGKHVHGEIDPHLWQDVSNVQAYVEVIRDQLIRVDPAHRDDYRSNAEDYLGQLEDTDQYVQRAVDSIPASNRHLVTTHDAYGYLAKAYGLDVAGFVAPTPGSEPSIADRRRLATTLSDLEVPAVFLEPNAQEAATTLLEAADNQGIEVCTLYGDAFTEEVDSYVAMMRANADSLASCLDP